MFLPELTSLTVRLLKKERLTELVEKTHSLYSPPPLLNSPKVTVENFYKEFVSSGLPPYTVPGRGALVAAMRSLLWRPT